MLQGIIAREFETYKAQVMHPEAGEVQIWECKRAFYAGASALYFKIMSDLSPGKKVTESDMNLMSGISIELEEFRKSVLLGGV